MSKRPGDYSYRSDVCVCNLFHLPLKLLLSSPWEYLIVALFWLAVTLYWIASSTLRLYAYSDRLAIKTAYLSPLQTIPAEDIVAIQALQYPVSSCFKGILPIKRFNPKTPQDWIVINFSNSVNALAIQTRDKKYLISVPITEETVRKLRELYTYPRTAIQTLRRSIKFTLTSSPLSLLDPLYMPRARPHRTHR